MPNIEFPNVPNVPGVPSIARNPDFSADYGDLVSAVTSGNPLSIIESVITPRWGIYAPNTMEKVIVPDSVLAFEYRGDARVSDYPVEAGGFKSYNKVQQPFDIRIKITCNGAGTLGRIGSLTTSGGTVAMTREDFLVHLEGMKLSLDLYDLVTPDFVYNSVNLIHFDYKRTNTEGVTLLIAELYLREVQQSTKAGYKTVGSDSATDSKNQGTVNTVTPTTTQSAAITKNAATSFGILDMLGGA